MATQQFVVHRSCEKHPLKDCWIKDLPVAFFVETTPLPPRSTFPCGEPTYLISDPIAVREDGRRIPCGPLGRMAVCAHMGSFIE